MSEVAAEDRKTIERTRRRPWSKTAPHDGPFDDIVIGSGMGGMTTAAVLARLGRRVLVLEQHYTPGGFTHSFKRPGGYHWDVGVHAVGEVTERSMPGQVLARLTDGALQWASLGPVYDAFHFPDDFRIDFPDTPAQFRDNLVSAFPREARAIDRYLELCREITRGMRPWFLGRALPRRLGGPLEPLLARRTAPWIRRRTSDVLRELTGDARLRTVLAGQWGYYGARPSEASFLIQALVTRHFLHGAFYPVGGAGRIAETLLATVAQAGGWTRIATPVERIVIERGRAVGVELAGGERIAARRVFSAIGVPPTLERLLPPDIAQAQWAQSITALPATPCHVCLHLGFRGDIREAGASAANQWFWTTWETDADDWRVEDLRGDRENAPEASVLYCSFPSLKDPTHDPGPEQRHTGEVVTFVPWEAFRAWQETRWHRRGGEYDDFKAALEASLLEQFLRRMPGLRPMVDHVELSTPLSTDHFVRPRRGAIYGIEPTPARFTNRWLRPRSPVPGLFFSGSDVGTVGVIGAMMGGLLAAIAAEPIDATRYVLTA